MISFVDLEDKRNELYQITHESNEYTTNDLKYLMLALYTYLPPMSQGIFIKTILLEEQTKIVEGYNYIYLQTGQFTYLDKIMQLPDELITNIRRVHDKTKSYWLLANVSDYQKPITNAHFTKMFNKLFGEGISTNYLKKLYNGTLSTTDSASSDDEEKNDASVISSANSDGFVYFEKVRISSKLLSGATIVMENGCLVILTK